MQRLAELGDRLGLVRLLRPVHDRWQPSLTVLAYHRIRPLDHKDAYPFDPELISATPAQFEWQMAYLRHHFNPVPLDAVVAHLDGGAPLPRAAVAVTFDDGFSDAYRFAYPILTKYAIPATIFITTGYVDSGEPFWFEVAAYLAMRAEPGTLRLEEYSKPFPGGHTIAERRESLREVQAILKSLPNTRRTGIMADWSRRFSACANRDALELSRSLSWQEIRVMARAGIGFGSHSVTHPNLVQLADTDLDAELRDSKRSLEEHLDRDINTLAYPIGTPAAFDARVIAAARHTGFRLAVSYVPGANAISHLERYALRRHGIDLRHTPRYFRALTSLPDWVG